MNETEEEWEREGKQADRGVRQERRRVDIVAEDLNDRGIERAKKFRDERKKTGEQIKKKKESKKLF